MNPKAQPKRGRRGYALLLVLVFMGTSSLMLAGVMQWIAGRARLAARQQAFQKTTAAAESALHKALASLTADFMAEDEARVFSQIGQYVRLTPTKQEHAEWDNMTFFDTEGRTDRLTVSRVEAWRYGPLRQRYAGMNGYYATYRLAAGAQMEALPGMTVGALVQYELQLADIPVFNHQFFSAMDLEFTPGSSMTLGGRIHANNNLYAYPDSATLTFRGDVSAGGRIMSQPNPEDPVMRMPGVVSYRGKCDENARMLKLPLDVAQQPATLRALIEVPPSNEKATSPLGRQRFYNKADLLITLNSAGFSATSGQYNNFTRSVPRSVVTNFVSTNVFFDRRESRQVRTVELDVSRFAAYGLLLRLYLGRDARTVYILNQLPAAPQTINAVRIINGETLPSGGLTVATPQPVYIRGHFNAPETFRGTTNTTQSLPAAIVADAVTVLSPGWNDQNSQAPVTSRRAEATTVNAAIITGIVPTGGGFYSGGAENYLRLLEDWRNVTLTFNGSIAVFYPSAVANAPWGALDDVYHPPRRAFAPDVNFQDAAKLPPGTPLLRTIIVADYRVSAAVLPGGK
ncbi:MAG: hypothetical protein N3J91_16190 [Verrucomicrobiae bacterium]|nr:hypothetical protein [Verrucomicrobiae bacterium]